MFKSPALKGHYLNAGASYFEQHVGFRTVPIKILHGLIGRAEPPQGVVNTCRPGEGQASLPQCCLYFLPARGCL